MVLRRAVFSTDEWWRRTQHDVNRAQGWHKYFRLRGGMRAEMMSVSGQLVEQIGMLAIGLDKDGLPESVGIHPGALRPDAAVPRTPEDDNGANEVDD